jgi:hypothetical protein
MVAPMSQPVLALGQRRVLQKVFYRRDGFKSLFPLFFPSNSPTIERQDF